MASRSMASRLVGRLRTASAPSSTSASCAATSRAFTTSSPPLAASPSSSTNSNSKTSPPPPQKPRRKLTFITTSGSSQFKTFLPVSPGLRHLRQPVSPHLHKGSPLRALTVAKRSTGGRNDQGKITIRARGGGHRRRIRNVDFERLEAGEQDVVRIEYDPGRSAHIALIKNRESGQLSYILAPAGLREGDVVQSFRAGVPESFRSESAQLPTPTSSSPTIGAPAGDDTLSLLATSTLPGQLVPATAVKPPAPLTAAQIDLGVLRTVALRPGNCLPLSLLPLGTQIHGISLSPTGPAILARSAGSSARLIALAADGKNVQIRMGSGEVRLIGLGCCASIGRVSNEDHKNEVLGKAGRKRWLGFRPQARGVAMNAKDHPHGGGRGKSKGNRDPVDPWGNSAKGVRTRAPTSKRGNKMVVKERPKGKLSTRSS